MRNFTKLFLLLAFITVSTVCKSQVFTAGEFVDLTLKSQEDLKNVLVEKGYTFGSMEKSGMSDSEVYVGKDGMNVSIITPNFKSDEKMLSWEFTNSESIYRNLEQELASSGFKRSGVESRAAYIVSTYTKPGVTVTLSRDREGNNKELYTLSARFTNAAWYNLK